MNEVDGILTREKAEPLEGSRTIPWPLLALWAGVSLFACSYYLTQVPAGPLVSGDLRTTSSTPQSVAVTNGESLFGQHCAACHQTTGLGLPGTFPPLAGSEWVKADAQVITRIVVFGVNGKLKVAGQSYQGQMPTFGAVLDDEKLASVITYVRGQWGNQAGPVTAEQVARVRQLESGRKQPWQGEAELRQRLGKLAPQ